MGDGGWGGDRTPRIALSLTLPYGRGSLSNAIM
jgi:hypothetical protein